MFHHQLRLNLSRLLRDRLRLGFIEVAAGDELNERFVSLVLLLAQRLDRRFLFLEDLPDLGLLRVGQIQIIHHHAHHWPAKHAVFVHMARAHALGKCGKAQ